MRNEQLLQLSQFQYFNELLNDMRQSKRPRVNKLYFSGTRKSGKTRGYQNFIISALIDPLIKCDAYLVRNQVQDATELFTDTREVMDELDIEQIKANKTARTLTYGKNKIRVIGVETNKKQKNKSTKKLGMAGGKNKDYGIIVFEEAYEFKQDDTHALIEAIRGYKYFIIIYATNPWSIMNWYVEYINQLLPFNEHLLRKDYQQFKYDKKNRRLIHYSSFKTNPYITADEIEQFKELEIMDPQRARISVYGLPGIAEGSVYSGYYEAILPLAQNPRWYQETDYFVGGIDWGERRDTTSAQLWAVGFGLKFVAGINEYTHSNKGNVLQKTNKDMCADILDMYIKYSYQYPKLRQQGMKIYVDYSATAIIELLNDEARQRGADKFLHFQACVKYPIKQRIDHFTLAMKLRKFFLVFDNFPALTRELQNSQYGDNGERLDINDHSINAKEYALAFVMRNLTRGFDFAFEE